MLRLILLFTFDALNQIGTIEPAHASTGITKGNEFVNFWAKVSTIVWMWAITIYHIAYHTERELSYVDLLVAVVIYSAFALRMWAYRELGKFFTFDIGIQKDHRLIKTGPYSLLAHPGYLGQFGMIMGFVFFCQLPFWIFLPIASYIIYRFWHRITAEEDMLRAHFQDEYDSYKKNVWLM